MTGALLLSVVYQYSPWIHKQFYRGEEVFVEKLRHVALLRNVDF